MSPAGIVNKKYLIINSIAAFHFKVKLFYDFDQSVKFALIQTTLYSLPKRQYVYLEHNAFYLVIQACYNCLIDFKPDMLISITAMYNVDRKATL